jgi:hypothetical protein
MMPHHLNMIRSQCRILASFGGGIATSLATIRLSPEREKEHELRSALIQMLGTLPLRPGLTGAHLLKTDTPLKVSQTTEQQIRGSDGVADWIVLISGYDPAVVEKVVSSQLSAASLCGLGAKEKSTMGHYKLALTMTPADVTPEA